MLCLGAHVLLSFIRVPVVNIIVIPLLRTEPMCPVGEALELAVGSYVSFSPIEFISGKGAVIPKESVELILDLSYIPHGEGNGMLKEPHLHAIIENGDSC